MPAWPRQKGMPVAVTAEMTAPGLNHASFQTYTTEVLRRQSGQEKLGHSNGLTSKTCT